MKTLNKVTVKANLQIIPNDFDVLNSDWNQQHEHSRKHSQHIRDMWNSLNLPKSEVAVDTWAYKTPGTCDPMDNFSCHGNPELLEAWKDNKYLNNYKFPRVLPLELFEGKKEGDVVVIDTPEARVELTLNQSGHRYKNFGNGEFHTLLEEKKRYIKK